MHRAMFKDLGDNRCTRLELEIRGTIDLVVGLLAPDLVFFVLRLRVGHVVLVGHVCQRDQLLHNRVADEHDVPE